MRNIILAASAVFLGLLALIIGNPSKGGQAEVTANRLLNMKLQENVIDVYKLADDIIKQKTGYRLVDIRSEDEYAKYMIPTAENIPLSKIGKDYFDKNDIILIYCNTEEKSIEAQRKLLELGFPAVYRVKGGIGEWKEKILFPKLPDNPSAQDVAFFKEIRPVSKFFGGKPAGPGGDDDMEIEMPKPAAPSAAPVKKKKKIAGGC